MKLKHFFSAFSVDVLVLFAFAGTLLYMTVPNLIVSLKPAVSFEEMLEEGGRMPEEGGRVSGRVPYSLVAFASETTHTEYQNGARSAEHKSGKYYLLPTAEGFIALKCNQKSVAAMDRLTDETYEFLLSGTEPSTEFFMDGKVEALEGSLARYYREAAAELGYTYEALDAMGTPLVVRNVNFTAVRILFAAAVVLCLLALLSLFRKMRIAAYGSGLPSADDLPG